MWRKRHVFMAEEGGAAAGGGAAGAGAAEAGSTAGASAAAAGSQSEAGSNGAAGSAGSLLAAGATGSGEGTSDYIPEKYRVNKEDGSFDLDASARKLAEAYGSAEKRIGTGDLPPKEASEYKVTVPDALKEAFDPATDAGMQGFLTGALDAGLTQKQVDFVMGKYFELAPQLAAGAAQFDANTATAELKKTWATDADFKRNVRNAFVGTNAVAAKAGMTVDEIMSSSLGNDPKFLRLMAAIGPEFQEDVPPGGSKMTSEGDINALLSSEAYTNPKHADHAKVSEQVRNYYARKYGTEAAA
jgi:hypothetical protein